MVRVSLLLAGILVSGVWAGAVRGQDDPVFRGKKLSEWLAMLRGAKDAEFRNKTLLVLGGLAYPRVEEMLYPNRRLGLLVAERIGPTNRQVVPAILDALRDDPDARIREGAAQALGRLSPKIKKDSQRLGETRERLTTALRMDPSAVVRQAAATALGVYDPESRAGESRDLVLVHDLTPSLPVLLHALRRLRPAGWRSRGRDHPANGNRRQK